MLLPLWGPCRQKHFQLRMSGRNQARSERTEMRELWPHAGKAENPTCHWPCPVASSYPQTAKVAVLGSTERLLGSRSSIHNAFKESFEMRALRRRPHRERHPNGLRRKARRSLSATERRRPVESHAEVVSAAVARPAANHAPPTAPRAADAKASGCASLLSAGHNSQRSWTRLPPTVPYSAF